MRVLAIVSDDVTYQPLVYEPIVKECHPDIIGLVVVPFRTREKPRLELLSFLYHLYGIKGFLIKSLQVTKLAALDALSRWVRLKRCYSLRGIADRYKVPLYRTNSVNSETFLKLVAELRPDLILSSQGHYMGRRLLSIPRFGVINKHAGLLPKYRGVYPVFWAMLNGEPEIGVSIHFMTEGLDAGEIILQKRIPIAETDTFETLYRKVVAVTPSLFISAIRAIGTNSVRTTPNDATLATCYSYPSRADIRRFRKMGKRII